MRYCPYCAADLTMQDIDGGERLVCGARCGYVFWDNPVPVVGALVRHEGRVLLARNAQWPEGRFSMITGYMEYGETPEAAILRETQEELGLEARIGGLIGHYALAVKNQLILAYWLEAEGTLRLGEEIAEVRPLRTEALRVYEFGERLSLTARIVADWLGPRKAD